MFGGIKEINYRKKRCITSWKFFKKLYVVHEQALNVYLEYALFIILGEAIISEIKGESSFWQK